MGRQNRNGAEHRDVSAAPQRIVPVAGAEALHDLRDTVKAKRQAVKRKLWQRFVGELDRQGFRNVRRRKRKLQDAPLEHVRD
jgi:hypothetical protein